MYPCRCLELRIVSVDLRWATDMSNYLICEVIKVSQKIPNFVLFNGK